MSNSTLFRRVLAVVAATALTVGGVTVSAGSAAAVTPTGSISGVISGEAYGAVPATPLGTDATAVLLKWSTLKKQYLGVSIHHADGTGAYSFTGLTAGRYSVQFSSDTGLWFEEVWNDVPLVSIDTVPTAINLTSGQNFVADAALERGFVISGVITGADTGATELEGASMTAVDATTLEPNGGNPFPQLADDTVSGYTTSLLRAGTYLLRFDADENDNHITTWYGGDSAATATEVVIDGTGDLPGYDAQLAVGGTISGTLTSTTGQPVWAYATAYDAGGVAVSTASSDSTDGTYTIKKLPTGSYTVGFSTIEPTFKPIIPEFYPEVSTRAEATVIDVVAGSGVGGKDDTLLLAKKFTALPKPLIAGAAKVGVTLTAKPGVWAPTPTSLTYDWTVNGASVSTASTYVVAPADLGKKVQLKVTALKDGYAPNPKYSAFTAAVVLGSITAVVPRFTGTVKVGSPLTALTGTWKPAATTLSYQWLRSGVAVPSATASTYTPVAADRGKLLALRITGAAPGYANKTSTSLGKLVAYGTLVPAAAPTITGTTTVGEVLTAVTADWAPLGTVLTYQWYSGLTPITGATASTFPIPGSQAGKKLSVKITGKLAGYTTAARLSLPTATIAKAIMVTGTVPTITGTAAYPSTLTAATSGWDASGTRSYQWLRDGAAITGATATTYAVSKSDRGHTITIRLTVTRTGYFTQTADSVDSRAIPAVVVTVGSSYVDSAEGDFIGLYLYQTTPLSVAVGGGESVELHAAPGFFDGVDPEVDVAWFKGNLGGYKAISYTTSPDGSTLYLTIPKGTTLATMKAKKAAGYKVQIETYIPLADNYTLNIVVTGLTF